MLTAIVLLGLTSFFVVESIRKVSKVQEWVLSGKRPWGCSVCMSFWASFASVGCYGWYHHRNVVFLSTALPVAAICYLLIELVDSWATREVPKID